MINVVLLFFRFRDKATSGQTLYDASIGEQAFIIVEKLCREY
jgi:hypothetical protein